MSEPFVGQIQMFGFNFPPRGWSKCDGQTLSISQNSALFSLLGTMYGGNGRTDFRLPDLRGRRAIHFGTGPGLPDYPVGRSGGQVTQILTVNEMPPHAHNYKPRCNSDEGSGDNPEGQYPSVSNENVYAATQDADMGMSTTDMAGGGSSFNILGPYLAVNFCIALTGVFPSRN